MDNNNRKVVKMEKKYFEVRDENGNRVETLHTTYTEAKIEAIKKYGYGATVRRESAVAGLR